MPNDAHSLADAMKLHEDLIVIDGTCPLLGADRNPRYLDWYKQGGATAAAPSIAGGPMRATSDVVNRSHTLDVLGYFHRLIHSRSDLLLVRTADDLLRAKKEGKLGIIPHFQGTGPIEWNFDLIDMFKAAGVGVIQLSYNVQDQFGSGILEPKDSGLSMLGVALVKRLNEAKVIVDVAHTGIRTALDAVERSTAPVIVSHGNPRAVHNNPRNIPDEIIKAVAQSGGFVGAVMYPAFVTDAQRPTLDDFIRHIDYLMELVGPDHVSISSDYFEAQWGVMEDADAQKFYDRLIASGVWNPSAYPPPPYVYPAGVETPKTLFKLTHGLLNRGYSQDDIRKIWGGNWLRVMRKVWG